MKILMMTDQDYDRINTLLDHIIDSFEDEMEDINEAGDDADVLGEMAVQLAEIKDCKAFYGLPLSPKTVEHVSCWMLSKASNLSLPEFLVAQAELMNKANEITLRESLLK